MCGRGDSGAPGNRDRSSSAGLGGAVSDDGGVKAELDASPGAAADGATVCYVAGGAVGADGDGRLPRVVGGAVQVGTVDDSRVWNGGRDVGAAIYRRGRGRLSILRGGGA